MFIPPEGALQFHATHNYDGTAREEPLAVWLDPRERPKDWAPGHECVNRCKTTRRVFLGSIPTHIKRRFTRARKWPSVCDCMGRIIE